MKFRLFAIITSIFISSQVFAQSAPFEISLEPINIAGLGGLQSYAFGQHNGKWLIVGGRLDGLHRRQPWATFDIAGHNTQLIVVDPVTQQKWTVPLTTLPVAMQEQLQSTNMEFYQSGAYLYLLGGYGYSATQGDHTTFGNMTAVHVQATIEAIIAGSAISMHFRQINDPKFQVTGGRLEKIYDTYYLVGGQKFIGRYNPMGPTHGPGFIQEYTNQIRKFTILDNGTNIVVNHLPSPTDAVNLHRRDYNVGAQIMPNGQEGLTAFSGVFQTTVDLPFLNAVNIDSTGYTVNNAFSQYYNHYHCANFPIYSAVNNEMHTVFFGGIAQYYDSLGVLVQDNNVPFVKTIARVTRSADGTMAEYKLPVEMPELLGAGSEWIPNPNIPQYSNGVMNYDELSTNPTHIGYIYGGISSSAANIFWINNGTESTASSQIYKVFLKKTASNATHNLNSQSTGSIKMMVYPNPNNGNFVVKYHLKQSTNVRISLYTMDGRLIFQETLVKQAEGDKTFHKQVIGMENGGNYYLKLETDYESALQKIIIEP